jgi:Putative DNA-binding domain
MKNQWDWEENDLLDIIKAGTQESIELDFKNSLALVNVKGKTEARYEISKDVSAFANSAGGTLIYGITEDKSTHIAASLDSGVDPTVITKEKLQQIITSTIHRKIDGIRVHQIRLVTHSPGNVAYVVYVPQSMRTPHQALDKKFYKRHEFESVPMEEYEVRDLYRRGEVPDLRITFILPKTEIIMNEEGTQSELIELHATIVNDALEPANYTIMKLFIDARLTLESASGFKILKDIPLSIGDKVHPVTFASQNWSTNGQLPIFHMPFSITSNAEPIKFRAPTDGRMGKHISFLLGYQIDSPRMPTKSAYSLLHIKSGYITFSDEYLSEDELTLNYDKFFRK